MADNLRHNLKGTALLLAMLVMSSLLIISAATSRLVISEVRQSGNIDKSIVAYYAAEGGLEQGMYLLRQQQQTVDDLNAHTIDLENNASFQFYAKDSEDVLFTNISKDDTYQVDIFKPGSLDPLAVPIKTLRISWEGTGSWLEARYSAWDSSGSVVVPDPQNLNGGYVSLGDPYELNLYSANTYLYRVRLTARNADITNLQIRAYSEYNPTVNERCQPQPPAGCQVPIPGRVSLKAIGQYPADSSEAAFQSIIATMPAKPPVANYFDYVIYSEQDVKKEN